MPDPRPSFRQEYTAFWSDRPVVTRYLLWLLVPGLGVPFTSGRFHQESRHTPAAFLWLLAHEAVLVLAGAVLIVANGRLKRRGAERTGGQSKPQRGRTRAAADAARHCPRSSGVRGPRG